PVSVAREKVSPIRSHCKRARDIHVVLKPSKVFSCLHFPQVHFCTQSCCSNRPLVRKQNEPAESDILVCRYLKTPFFFSRLPIVCQNMLCSAKYHSTAIRRKQRRLHFRLTLDCLNVRRLTPTHGA